VTLVRLRLTTALVILPLALTAGGCATGSGESRIVQLAERPTWEVNDSWTYAGRRASGPYTLTRKVVREGLFEGYPAYEVDAGDTHYWFTKRLGYLARLNGDKVVRRAIPPEDFQWPLQVGKQWSSTFTWIESGEPERRSTVTGIWAVEAYEEVKTPAGTFKAFKVSRREVQSGASQEFWYSPAVKGWVKLRVRGGPEGDYEEELTSYSAR
jgi:hypothetical protein